jgi:hypothetical protein
VLGNRGGHCDNVSQLTSFNAAAQAILLVTSRFFKKQELKLETCCITHMDLCHAKMFNYDHIKCLYFLLNFYCFSIREYFSMDC